MKRIAIILMVLSLNGMVNFCNAQILLTTFFDAKLRASPDIQSNVLSIVKFKNNVEVLDYFHEGKFKGYFKVEKDGLKGYIHEIMFACDDSFYLAINIRNGNAQTIYSENQDFFDRSNNIKMKEEIYWNKNYKKTGESNPIVIKKGNTYSISENIVRRNPQKKIKRANKLPKKDIKVVHLKKNISGTYEIPCKVNGLKLKFIFDTGASNVSISLTEALFMLKNGYLSEEDIKGKEYYSIANGEIQEGTSILIKRLEFEGLVLKDIEASIVHNLGAPLLLGQSALRKLGKIQIDYTNDTLSIIN